MARSSRVLRQVVAVGLLVACARSPALALQLGPSASGATPFGAGATVESLFSTEELEAHLGQGHVHVAATCVLPDGDVVVGLQVGFAGAALVHWEAQGGALTTIARELELGTAMGGYQGGALSIHALDATATGELWLFASEFLGLFGGLSTTAHLLRLRLSGPAPEGYASPSSELALAFDPQAEQLNLRAHPAGGIELVLDTGDLGLDALPLAPGHGLYRWFPDLSIIPLHAESYRDLAAATARGGPSLSGDASAEDTGITNLAPGLTRSYLVHAASAENLAPNHDASNGEAYDGDLLVFDAASGSASVLVSRKRYLAVTNALGGADPADLSRDVFGISLELDEARERLYTLEYTYAPHAANHQVVMLLQWNALTGELEGVVANAWDLLRPWLELGQDPVFSSGGVQIGASVTEGNLALAPDGSLLVAVAPGDNTLPGRVLRVTPLGL